jgi:hypothetical protein
MTVGSDVFPAASHFDNGDGANGVPRANLMQRDLPGSAVTERF